MKDHCLVWHTIRITNLFKHETVKGQCSCTCLFKPCHRLGGSFHKQFMGVWLKSCDKFMIRNFNISFYYKAWSKTGMSTMLMDSIYHNIILSSLLTQWRCHTLTLLPLNGTSDTIDFYYHSTFWDNPDPDNPDQRPVFNHSLVLLTQ